MKKAKPVFYSELSYLIGTAVLSAGTALMEKASFGMSMVVAPAYVLFTFFSRFLPFLTFGMTEYIFQGFLILLIGLINRRFRLSYLFSFVTAVFYGVLLDGAMKITAVMPDALVWRSVFYAVGLLLCSTGVSMLFHTYFAPEAYELFVKEFSTPRHLNIHRFKTVYDVLSAVAAILLSVLLFGFVHPVGVHWGTVLCALINGFVISRITKLLESVFEFKDALRWRAFFEG